MNFSYNSCTITRVICALMMCIINIHCYRDGEIIELVSPPFGEVAQQAYDNPHIALLLRDPRKYNPAIGKTGIAFSIIYYIRNARLAIQYYATPSTLKINNENHKQIWSKVFSWEMQIFSTFKVWYDSHQSDDNWRIFVNTVYDVFNNKLKPYLPHFINSETFPISMPIFVDNGVGAKFLPTTLQNDNIPSSKQFDKINPFIPTFTNPNNFPLIGFGSWPLTKEQCKDVILKAFKTGYRLIDTSENYNNERMIAEAISESGIDRSKIMIASKLSHNENYGTKVTSDAFYKTLDNLGIEYIDIYMLHGAISDKVRLRQAWIELEQLYNDGKIKYLGVSNFGPNDMNQLLEYATIKPMFIQNKFDPFTQGQQTPWLPSIEEWTNHYNQYNEDNHTIIIQAYCLLNSWPHQISAVNDKHIEYIANKYGVTNAQLLIRWALQHQNIAVLIRSEKEQRQLNNLNVFNFNINDVDMQLINGLNTLFSPFDIQWMHDVYGQVSNRPNVNHQEL